MPKKKYKKLSPEDQAQRDAESKRITEAVLKYRELPPERKADPMDWEAVDLFNSIFKSETIVKLWRDTLKNRRARELYDKRLWDENGEFATWNLHLSITEAIKKFDPSRGSQFPTFFKNTADMWIRHNLSEGKDKQKLINEQGHARDGVFVASFDQTISQKSSKDREVVLGETIASPDMADYYNEVEEYYDELKILLRKVICRNSNAVTRFAVTMGEKNPLVWLFTDVYVQDRKTFDRDFPPINERGLNLFGYPAMSSVQIGDYVGVSSASINNCIKEYRETAFFKDVEDYMPQLKKILLGIVDAQHKAGLNGWNTKPQHLTKKELKERGLWTQEEQDSNQEDTATKLFNDDDYKEIKDEYSEEDLSKYTENLDDYGDTDEYERYNMDDDYGYSNDDWDKESSKETYY